MFLTALAAAASVIWLQQRFDAADAKAGVAIAQSYRAGSGRSLPDVLASRHPGAAVSWRGSEQSSCFQHVRVDALVTPATPAGALGLDYEFAIDLNGPSIHPGNPLGQEALEALDLRGDAAP